MSRSLRITAAWLLVCCLTACGGGVKPQLPTQRSSRPKQENTEAVTLMLLNQRLAEEADQQLADRMHQRNDSGFALRTESNTWVKWMNRHDNEPQPADGETWLVGLRVYTTADSLLTDEEMLCTIGKTELPTCVSEMLTEMHHGDTIEMMAPWYAAYGSSGNRAVPAYSNVKIVMTLQGPK